MLEPVGPLPPSVYWRRRALAAIVGVLVLALLIWALSAAFSADSRDVAAPAPAPADAPPSPVASRSALAVPPGGSAALGQVGDAPAPAAPGAAPTPGAAPAPGGGPSPALPGADPTVPSGGATPPLLGATSTDPLGRAAAPGPVAPAPAPPAAPSSSPAPPPGPCADSALRVAARTDAKSYTAADRPEFSLVVTNTGKTPCTRDLGPARTAMAVVRTAGDGLWGSDDCAPGGDPDVRTLAPGQEQVLSLRWAGRTSLPGCSGGREAVPAGKYQLLTRLDGTISDPAPFTIASS
ncbi:hypothetical protein [Actinomycetospora termitidis]|uniref:MucR family transcriptional regulator n=1 Tax=Actinomycetospora termitidis TaxID=3053470 RepID=A0ABT7MAE2_9PSEU|nr:hypothetical protein [Actinomycetospora sp. Odt1-22]MDL5157629.1 hypothetical protein [Actinomycetospora sp. Odt1-22]